ncbi:endonuclease III [Lysobacter capsici]|nr:endonuclease III [Lysobacter capsici]
MPKTPPAKSPAKPASATARTASKNVAAKKSAAAADAASKAAGKPGASKSAAKKSALKKPAPGRGSAATGKPASKPAAKTTAKAEKRSARLSPPEIEEMFSRLQSLNPHPTTELEYSTPYELLVAVALSAQATDVGVNKATRKLFPIANTPRQIAALGVDGLKPYIATIGLFNTKAANVVALSQQLIDLHGGEVPRDRAALEALPGVGRKTANVVLNTAFGEPTIAVDTHIFRVSNRTGLAPGKDVVAVEQGLLKVVPQRYLQDAHHWLILHGRYVCKARKPDCPHCVIRDLCRFQDKTPGDPEPVAA